MHLLPLSKVNSNSLLPLPAVWNINTRGNVPPEEIEFDTRLLEIIIVPPPTPEPIFQIGVIEFSVLEFELVMEMAVIVMEEPVELIKVSEYSLSGEVESVTPPDKTQAGIEGGVGVGGGVLVGVGGGV